MHAGVNVRHGLVSAWTTMGSNQSVVHRVCTLLVWHRHASQPRDDVNQRSRPPRYVIRQMLREMLPGERAFIHPLRKQADLVVRDQVRGLEDLLVQMDRAFKPDSG